MKKLLIIILCLCMLFSLAACGKKKQGPQGEPGKDGINGIDGKDGVTPTIEISDDGYWVINGEKTDTKAVGTDGKDSASASDENPYGLEFEMIDYSYVVSMCETTSENIVIPETYNGRAVVGIKDNAFRGLVNIKSVTIPDTVTSIGNHAFEGCTSLTSVTIPDSVTYIGYEAFYNCANLTSVTIGTGVTSIGSYAFSSCTSLTSVTIPDSVTSIGGYAFNGCTSLASIDVDPDNAYYKSIDGNLYNKDGKILIRYAPGKTDTTFSIPDGVTSISDYAFDECTSLTSVTIPDSFTSISNYAFYGCTNLASVTIPDSITSISDYVFDKCTSLASIDVDPDNAYYKSIDGNLYNKDGKTLIRYAPGKTDTTFSIPDGVTSIRYKAFSGCTNLASVTIPDSFTSIGSSAFSNCSSLASVVIPDSVTSIGYEAFYGCSSLTTINYCGTEAQWNAITKYSDWDYGTGDYTIVYNYNG